MTNQPNFISADHGDRDLYASSRAAERILNEGIVQANITEGFEEHLKIFDAFYADEVEVSSDTREEPICGKASVRSLLVGFLLPLHVFAEISGLSISIRQTPIRGDVAYETHSTWTLDLAAPSGAICKLSWRSLRRWNGARVVYERHYDHRQAGAPLTWSDLCTPRADLYQEEFRRPS
jgi:hypothetical protein